eukprot:1131295-Pyramimonas_sp.AAC.1
MLFEPPSPTERSMESGPDLEGFASLERKLSNIPPPPAGMFTPAGSEGGALDSGGADSGRPPQPPSSRQMFFVGSETSKYG